MGFSKEKSKKLTAKEKLYQSTPVWISMIDSPGVNYQEAINAFDLFWSKRPKPVEEEFEGKNGESEKLSKKEKESMQYIYEYKRFIAWKHFIFPSLDTFGNTPKR